jgi:branched-chain amino acid transport system substrate-binding protein
MIRSKNFFITLGVLAAFALCSIGFPDGIALALERNVIKIGVASGLKRPTGLASLQGAEMATKEINDAGGVLGAKIQLFTADTEQTAPKATEAIEKLYYTDKVDTIVGAYSSEEATAFQEQSAKLKINIIFHGTTSIMDKKYKADPEKYKYYWNYKCSDLHYLEHVMGHQLDLFVSAFKKQLGIDKVNIAIVTDVALWAETIHVGYQEGIKARPDCKLVYTGKIARDSVDFSAELTEMRTQGVQLILSAMGFAAGYNFVKQTYDVRLPAMISGINGVSWSTSEFLKAVGVDAAAYNSSLGQNSLPTTPHTAQLVKKYEQIYGGVSAEDVGSTYNGVKAYAKAVEIVRSLDHDKVQMALKKVRLPEREAWNCKEFWFDDTHRVHVSPVDGLILYTFQFTPNGDVNILIPTEYKKGDILIPGWMVNHWKKK